MNVDLKFPVGEDFINLFLDRLFSTASPELTQALASQMLVSLAGEKEIRKIAATKASEMVAARVENEFKDEIAKAVGGASKQIKGAIRSNADTLAQQFREAATTHVGKLLDNPNLPFREVLESFDMTPDEVNELVQQEAMRIIRQRAEVVANQKPSRAVNADLDEDESE